MKNGIYGPANETNKGALIEEMAKKLNIEIINIPILKPGMHVKFEGKVGTLVSGKAEGEMRFYHEPDWKGSGYYTEQLPIIESGNFSIPTSAEILDYEVKCFSWGEVINVIDIDGKYQIFEYIDRHNGATSFNCFSCYINYKRIGRSADTLDIAILTILAHKYDGCNSQAASFMYKMLEMDKYQEVV